MIAGGQVLRPGQGIALRAVELLVLRPDGQLEVTVAQGTPAAEVLQDAISRRRIEEELSGRLGRPIRLADIGKDRPLPPRVTQESSRAERLAELVEGDEGLQNVVDKLDLELMD